MERKIGEIFGFGGEWYQCINATCACKGCQFFTLEGLCSQNCDDCILGHCENIHRADNKDVIFKKLENVGEPYHNSEKKLCQQYKCYIKPLVTDEIVYVFADNRAVIEIKQNREDMEEKKLNLKPFDIQKAREGKPVCTRDGRKARIICFDRKVDTPIVALIEHVDGSEILQCYFDNGICCHNETSDYDLMMLPEKKEGWVNVYKGGLLDTKSYPTKKEAFDKASPEDYVDTVKINWEE